MRGLYKKILCSFLVVFMAQNADANEQGQLQNRFLKKIDEVVLIVEDKKLSKDVRNRNIVKALTPMFDFELMAKLSLGNAWKELSAKDAKKFVDLYVERMKNSYSAKIDAYEGEKVEIKKIEQPKSDRIAFVTDLTGKENRLEIVYKFYKPKTKISGKDEWLIYDVEIMGVSILKTDRAQFREFLQTKSINELMDVLAKQL